MPSLKQEECANCDELREQNLLTSEALDALTTENYDLSAQIDDLKIDNDALSKKAIDYETLQQENDRLSAHNHALSTKASECEMLRQQFEQMKNENDKKHELHQKDIVAMENLRVEMKKLKEYNKSILFDKASGNDTKKREIQALLKKLDELKSDHNEALSAKTNEYELLRQKFGEMKLKNDDLNEHVDENAAALDGANLNLKLANDNLFNTRNEIAELTIKYDAMEKEKAQIQNKLDSVNEELKNMKMNNVKLNELHQNDMKCLSNLSGEHIKLQQANKTLQGKCNKMEEMYGTITTEISNIRKIYRSKESELKQKNDKLNAELSQLTKKCDPLYADKLISELKECALNGPASLIDKDLQLTRCKDGIKRTQKVIDLQKQVYDKQMVNGYDFTQHVEQRLDQFFEDYEEDSAEMKNTNPITSMNKLRLNEITEKFIITTHRTKALIGEYGLRATQDIKDDTILGRLAGLECTFDEWFHAVDGTKDEEKNIKYMVKFEVGKDQCLVVIDPMAREEFGPLFGPNYINDCKDKMAVRLTLAIFIAIGGVITAIGYYVYAGEVSTLGDKGDDAKRVAYYIGYTILAGGLSGVWALDIVWDDVKANNVKK